MLASIVYIATRFVVGGVVGLTGIGGGSLLTPILVFAFGQPPAVAVGTDLAFAATTRLVASGMLGQAHRVDWKIVRYLLVGSIPAALTVLIGLWLAPRYAQLSDRVLVRSLAASLVATAAAVLCQSQLRRLGLRATAGALARSERLRPWLTVLAGLVVGISVTLTSVGAGAVASALLVGVYPLRLSGERLVATDIAFALPLTLVAAGGHAALGHLDLAVLGRLLLGAVPSALLVRWIGWRIPQPVFRPALAILLVGCAARMLPPEARVPGPPGLSHRAGHIHA